MRPRYLPLYKTRTPCSFARENLQVTRRKTHDLEGILGRRVLAFDCPHPGWPETSRHWSDQYRSLSRLLTLRPQRMQLADCHAMLLLAASTMGEGIASDTLNLENLQWRTTVCPPDAQFRQDVLLAQDGRSLQLAVFGDTPLAEALLLTPALPSPALASVSERRVTDKRSRASRTIVELVFLRASRFFQTEPAMQRPFGRGKILSARSFPLRQRV